MTEQKIAAAQEDAAEITTGGSSVTGTRLVTDGNLDKEATVLDPRAGAGSEAGPESGIPSAVKQHRVHGDALPEEESARDDIKTPLPDRVQPMRQNLEP